MSRKCPSSNESFEVLDQKVTKIMEKLNTIPELVTPDNDLRMNTAQLEIDVDREKSAS